jgi:hypothetical protein
MALLETISEMKSRGMNDLDIVNALKEQGITPREINEALSQARIKSAIANPEEMQQSVMRAQEQIQNQQYAQEQYSNQQYPQDQQQYQQEQYQQQGYYNQTIDLETVREVARQEIESATNKLKQEQEKSAKILNDLKFEVQSIENRLNKIEAIIQELQTSIIRKMGDYGEAVSNLNKELRATQNSFAKVINPLMDKKRNIEKNPDEEEIGQEEKQNKQKSRAKSKDSPGVEDYFR